MKATPVFLAAMLKAAATRQTPTRSAQNMCPGSHPGTIPAMIFVAVKCSAPKTAIGAAMNTWAKGDDLIQTLPCANSFLAV